MNALIYQIVAATVALAVHVPKEAPPIPLEVLNVASGNDSQMERPFQTLVTDKDSWSRVWEMHKGPPTFGSLSNPDGIVPTIDFEKSNVIAIFLGSTTGIEGLTVSKVTPEEKQSVIDLLPTVFPGSGAVVANPFCFLQITKSKLPVEVRIQAGARSRILGRFTPPPDPKKPTDSKG